MVPELTVIGLASRLLANHERNSFGDLPQDLSGSGL